MHLCIMRASLDIREELGEALPVTLCFYYAIETALRAVFSPVYGEIGVDIHLPN
jgi:hypothetical protein